MLQIFGLGSHQLGLILAPEQRAAAVGRDYWTETDVGWIYFVGAHFGS